MLGLKWSYDNGKLRSYFSSLDTFAPRTRMSNLGILNLVS